MPRYWTCSYCDHRQAHAQHKGRRCEVCGHETRPARRRPKHAQVLEQTAYGDFAVLSVLIHGGTPHACGVCGKLPGANRHCDRDHDHRTGRPRGLACGGNQGCNVLMLPWVTPEVALLVSTQYHDAGNMREGARWFRVCLYLRRVEAFYAQRGTEAAS